MIASGTLIWTCRSLSPCLGPYSRLMPWALWWSQGGGGSYEGVVSYERGAPVNLAPERSQTVQDDRVGHAHLDVPPFLHVLGRGASAS